MEHRLCVMNAYHEQWCLVLEHTTTMKRLLHSYHFPAWTILGGHSTAEEPRELEEDTVADKQDLKDTHTYEHYLTSSEQGIST